MLIRSQWKTRIVNIANIQCIDIDGYTKEGDNYYRHLTEKLNCFIINCDDTSIGEYSTEEKAIKVLDMIQDDYDGKKVISMDNNGYNCLVRDNNPRIFIMPQDSEVDI